MTYFSPLWTAYLAQNILPHREIAPTVIQLDATARKVILEWYGRKEEVIITRNLVFKLLQILSSDLDRVFNKEELIAALYDDALFQLVTTLRKSLDVAVKKLCPDMTTSCIQNVWGIGYRLSIDLPT